MVRREEERRGDKRREEKRRRGREGGCREGVTGKGGWEFEGETCKSTSRLKKPEVIAQRESMLSSVDFTAFSGCRRFRWPELRRKIQKIVTF